MANFQFIRQSLAKITPLSDESWAPIERWITTAHLEPQESALRCGEAARNVLVIERGLLREFYIDREGRSATRRFCAAGDLSGSLADLLSGEPAMVSIEAVEPTDLWVIPWRRVDELTQAYPQWQMLVRRVAENLYLRKSQREFEMLTLSAAQRYAAFCVDHAALLPRLSQQLVASYLGITSVHLSRLRAANKVPPAADGRPEKK
jgi:CRP-like cAMP-binding protein